MSAGAFPKVDVGDKQSCHGNRAKVVIPLKMESAVTEKKKKKRSKTKTVKKKHKSNRPPFRVLTIVVITRIGGMGVGGKPRVFHIVQRDLNTVGMLMVRI